MNRENIFHNIKNILIQECEISLPNLNLQTSLFDDLMLDSVTLINLTCKLEDRFDIHLPLDMDLCPETIEELIELILKQKQIAC